ncbi:hypothetical protein F7725_026789 [Dissostichus mawsoni]|uniref:DUF4371 domain-containing protein n=1 Tax=Dissostichus mawsoni TaxID=36200 RepID=A0A7J5X804_DISMA|nr:hypothetical protein F7725_026789 [Dissostichus mawsoni]
MSGNVRGVQTVMRETYPNAQFVHCYAHQLNLTLQQLCSARMSILKRQHRNAYHGHRLCDGTLKVELRTLFGRPEKHCFSVWSI